MKNINFRFIIFLIILMTSGYLQANDTFELAAEINNLKQNDPYISSRIKIKDAGIKNLLDGVQNSKLLVETTENKIFKTFMLNIASTLSSKGLLVVDEKQAPKLHAVIQSMSDALKMPKPFIFIVFDKKLLNAAAFSFSKQAALIFIGEKLLNTMNDSQIKAILAHELGHIYYNHVPKRVGLSLLTLMGVVSAGFGTYFLVNDKLPKFFDMGDAITQYCAIYASILSIGGFASLSAYLMSKYFISQEREADDIAIKIAGAGSFTESMEQVKGYYLTKLEEFKKEYEFLQQKIEELEKISPEAAAELKLSANVYKTTIDGIYKSIIETGAITHPAINERIETGKNAQKQEAPIAAA